MRFYIMQFEGEHLLVGKIGHFFVLLAFVSSLLATIAYFTAARKNDIAGKKSWVDFARISFLIQTASVLAVFICIFYICSNHYIEYRNTPARGKTRTHSASAFAGICCTGKQ